MKKLIATRVKKKEPKALLITLIILAIASIVMGTICVINPFEGENLSTLGIVLFVLTAVYILLLCFTPRMIKKIRTINSYPTEALVVDENTLYIITNKLTKIALSDIKSVKGCAEVIMGVFFKVIKNYGTLTIKTSQKQYTLSQIDNIVNTTKLLKSIIK